MLNAKRALTPRSLNVKLGPPCNYHKGQVALRHYTHNVDAIGTFIQPGEGPSRGLLRNCENQLLPMDRLQHYKYLLQNGQEGPPYLFRIGSRRHRMRRVHRWALLQGPSK